MHKNKGGPLARWYLIIVRNNRGMVYQCVDHQGARKTRHRRSVASALYRTREAAIEGMSWQIR